jgi:hypothetical protein
MMIPEENRGRWFYRFINEGYEWETLGPFETVQETVEHLQLLFKLGRVVTTVFEGSSDEPLDPFSIHISPFSMYSTRKEKKHGD